MASCIVARGTPLRSCCIDKVCICRGHCMQIRFLSATRSFSSFGGHVKDQKELHSCAPTCRADQPCMCTRNQGC